jgi:hypothetical protein
MLDAGGKAEAAAHAARHQIETLRGLLALIATPSHFPTRSPPRSTPRFRM